MDWKDISGLLGSASRLFQSNYLYKKAVSEAVFESFNLSIPEKDISLKNGVVYIQTEPLIKGEIFLNKKNIIESINKRNLSVKIIDIR